MNIVPITNKEFNDNTHFVALDGDLSFLVDDNLYCCCQTDNEMNNILVQAKKPKIMTMKCVLLFLKVLYEQYNIRYISIYLENQIWKKVFNHFLVLQSDKDENQYYADLQLNIKEINRRLKK